MNNLEREFLERESLTIYFWKNENWILQLTTQLIYL